MYRFRRSAAAGAMLFVALLAGSAAARPLGGSPGKGQGKKTTSSTTASSTTTSSTTLSTSTTTTTTTTTTASSSVTSGNPLAGLRLYVNPTSDACKQASAWATSNPAGAAVMAKLCAQPGASWLGGWFTNISKATSDRVTAAAAAGAIATLVVYNIYERGWNLAGGAASPADYETWIDGVAAGLAGRSAIIVLEPDALAFLGRLSASDQQIRLQLLSYAVAQLRAAGGIVYIDAGHSGWNPAATMVARLQAADVAHAQGFSLNVANHQWTANELAYGDAIASGLGGGAHFLVDTGRNGAGPGSTSCNDPAWALGPVPQLAPGDPLADGYLWLKEPGISDGSCNGGSAAGSWWADGALQLAHKAGW